MAVLIDRAVAPHHNEAVGDLNGIAFYKVSSPGFPRQELNAADPDYEVDRTKALTRLCKEGVNPMTKAEQDEERALNWKLIKRLTMAIFSNAPPDLFSFLVSDFLDREVDCPAPEDRLAMVAAGIIASFHLALQLITELLTKS